MSPSSHATVKLVIQPKPGDRRYVPILMTAPIRSSSSSINSTLERQRRQHARVDLSILHASGASPLTRCVGDQHLPPVADRPVTRPARSHSARSITATTVSGSLNACRCTSCFAGARDRVKAYASSWHDLGCPRITPPTRPRASAAATAPTRSTPITTGTGDQAVRARPTVARRVGHRDVSRGAGRSRGRDGADV
jgi:hypothetical protein